MSCNFRGLFNFRVFLQQCIFSRYFHTICFGLFWFLFLGWLSGSFYHHFIGFGWLVTNLLFIRVIFGNHLFFFPNLFFPRLERVFGEELGLIFEFSVLIKTHWRITTLRCDVLEKGVNTDSLNKLPVSFKGLHLGVLSRQNTPQNWGAIQRTRNQVLGVVGPSQIKDVSNVTSELSGVSPLDRFLQTAKLNWNHAQRPQTDHVVVWARSQVDSVWGEADTVYGGLVAALQVVLMLGTPLLASRFLLLLILIVVFFRFGAIFFWVIIILCFFFVSLWHWLGLQLPESDSSVVFAGLRTGYEVHGVGEKVNWHDTGWSVVPHHLGNVNLHLKQRGSRLIGKFGICAIL